MWPRTRGYFLIFTCISTLCMTAVIDACDDGEFICDGTDVCMPKDWLCDGYLDCEDETDEQNCESESKRSTDAQGPNSLPEANYHGRGSRYRSFKHGPHIELIECLPNYMRCPGEEICIPVSKFCDNNLDCPVHNGDEGTNCTVDSHVSNCDKLSCEHKCQMTVKGPMCYCPEGKQPNGTKCIDVDRCLYKELYCDQKCKSKEGAFICSCVTGYKLKNQRYCEAVNEPVTESATLLVADSNRVRRLKISDGTDVVPPVNIAGHGIKTIDFNHRNHSACWLSYMLTKRQTTMQCVDLNDLSKGWRVSTQVSLDIITQIAQDWITGNWYFVDSIMKRIIVCDSDVQNCHVIIELRGSNIKNIRLDPTRGFMFFVIIDAKVMPNPEHIDGTTAIVRASLDGNNQISIMSDKLVSPYDITLDIANQHLYWTDTKLKTVMRINYDGGELRKIYSPYRQLPNTHSVMGFGITVFENSLYLASQDTAMLTEVHRYNYSRAIRSITTEVDKPFQIHVYHHQRQPDLPAGKTNPCKDNTCQHLCIPDWSQGEPEAKCYCAAGYSMSGDTCIEKLDCPEPECVDESCPSTAACNVSTPCRKDYNRCPLSECIPLTWWCDGESDCDDTTDEQFCAVRTCTVEEFRCKDGQCIGSTFLCDGTEDCNDGTDELFCTKTCDKHMEFTCVKNGACVSVLLKCNGMNDCIDGSDEENCTDGDLVTFEPCHSNIEFTCSDGQCIPSIWRCDGDEDCNDESDEKNCGPNHTPITTTCSNDTDSFLCNNRCIPSSWKCDGDYDCVDKSDEADCHYNCETPNFFCKSNMKCIGHEHYCDGKQDCDDNSDEIDCDKCGTWGICSQNCSQVGTEVRKCSCFDGYQLESDGFTCKPTGSEPVYIIFSSQHQMRRVDLTNKTYTPLVSGLKNTIALDFYYKKSWIFWTDVVDDKIFRGTMLGNSLTNIEPIIDVGLATTEGLAIDWVGENIYWVESNLDQIEVAKLNGSFRTTLIAGDMISPRAIVLDPRVGSLFWTDWDSEHPRIERCSLSGTERKVIFNITKLIGSGWPNGLTIDYDFFRLYWIDARSDSVHTTNYDGQDHRLILKGHEKMRHPFALTLFGNHIYWTDWSSSALMRANKFNGTDVKMIQKTLSQPFDLQVYHPHRQPGMENPCGENNCGCSHLCLLGYNHSCTCHCPHLYKLKDDNKTCETDDTFLLFVKRNEIRGVNLQNAHYNVIPTITIPNVDMPTAIDYDLDTERLYWADKALHVINSAHINGSGVETIIDSGISSPEGFAIDWLSKNMYFSSLPFENKGHKATISVAKLDGAYRAEITPENVVMPNSLAVCPTQGMLFWSDKTAIGQTQYQICRSRLDGSEGKVLIPNVHNPTSLQVDMTSKQLFWANSKSGFVMSCDFDGETVQKIFPQKQVLTNLLAITVYQNTLYLSHDQSKIAYMSIHGDRYGVLRDKTQNVQALKVFDTNSRKGEVNSCVQNNGGCAHLCLPVDANNHVCKCTAGYRLIGKKCEGIESFLMWSSRNEIHGISFDISEKTTALPHISKVSKATAVDFHADTDTVYWVDGTAYTITSIKRDLTGRKDVVEGEVRGVVGMAVDWIAGNVYWTDYGEDIIEAVRINGSEQRYVVIHGDMDKPKSIVVYPQKGLLFWTDVGTTPKIEQARLDGSRRKAIVTSNISSPQDLTVDYDTDILYWCDKETGKLESYNIITTERKVVLAHGAEDCVSITVFKDFLYWLKGGTDGSIKRVNKQTATDIQIVRENLGPQLHSIKAFDKSRQTGENPCQVNNGGCQEFCFYLGDNTIRCACSYGRLSETDFKSCQPHKEFLLYSKVTAIDSLGLDKTNLNHPVRPFQDSEHLRNVIGLTTHYKKSRLYFSDIQRGDIQFVLFNDTKYHVVIGSVGSAEGLAYEETSNYLYWTSYTNSSISRVLIDPNTGLKSSNATVEKLVQLGVTDHPRAIAIDSCSGRMFWTNWHDESPRIQRSFLNGYQPQDIITDQVWTPNGLTIDHKEQRLYWSDARLDKIERCDLDGNNRVVVVSTVPEHSFGMAVYGNYLYWTDWIRRAVIRSNKYDGNDIHFMQRNLERQPMGIVVVAEDAHDCTTNPCYNNAFGCDDLCTHDKAGQVQCKCSTGILLSDGKRCGPVDNKTCAKEDFVCHDVSACIPVGKVCNNIVDCVDGSDEFPEVCGRKKCDLEYFTCNNFRCVMLDKFCDRKDDCGDGSDEINCKCNADEFQCQSGLCIKHHYRCDRDKDCPDFDDEIGCTDLSCDHLEIFQEEKGPIVPCNKTSQCIMESWKCDGNVDCWDHSDELGCDNQTTTGKCSDGGFLCDIGTCIPQQWVCDADDDCTDNSDEANCNYTCESNMFQCNESKVCLPRSWECDGHSDCSNESDEGDQCHNTNRTCKEEEFKCNGTGRCIPKQWTCDGDIDCRDGEDEKTDSVCPACTAEEFQCQNGRCIRNIFLCDRDDDCGDGSDEPDSCVFHSCTVGKEFQCKRNGTCIDVHLKCNGFPDCPDHSDEEDCAGDPCKAPHYFLCDNGVCLNDSLVCDGRDDCGDFSDEPENCYIMECKDNHVCSHKCLEKKIGYECECDKGYELSNDKFTCNNIDECLTQYPCSHFCHDTIGSYYCSCAQNYHLEPDRHGCKFVGEEKPVLIVANRYYLRNVTFSGEQTLLASGLNNAVAVGFHHNESMIYWTDITSKDSTINRMKIGKILTKEVVHSSTVRNPDGLAIDWVGHNLYWCDKTTDTIEVSHLDGYYRKVLIKEGLEEPRALEVFPAKGYMFYTDWGEKAHISRATMDGSVTEKIITEDLSWPNALTIDYVSEKIFWADASLDYIAVANIDGSHRRIILDNDLPHTFALTTFQDYIFWTDWERGSIQRANKISGGNRTTVCTIIHRLMDIQVYHRMRQAPVPVNPCEHNGGCSHLCLLKPGNVTALSRVCACPENHILLPNGTCRANCTSSQILCSRSSKCIPSWWKCDGQKDCDDGSDEPHDCPSYKCGQPGLFRCKNSSTHCIPPIDICDGMEQCADGSDELECDKYHCMDGYIKCEQESKCIPKARICDGTPHCTNSTDEQNCSSIICQDNQFQCDNHRCVPYVWKCDGDDDCGDASDEKDDCSRTKCKSGYFRCKSGRCIPDSWKCDGDVDCGLNDNTDEDYEHCYNRTCDDSFFRCDNNHCIPGRWRCDYDNDCRDGSDEKNCTYRQCTSEEFQCDNKKCIPKSWQCNGEINCEDGTDERACKNNKCTTEEFGCGGICIPKKWQCDEDIDCPDGTDEKNCNERKCNDGKFRCSNTQCIPQLWKCDGDPDCDDGSDEVVSMCKDHPCPLGRFRCSNHKCLFTSKRCDGIDQCGDGSDEINCYYDTICRPREFKCKQDKKCIPMHEVCDGKTNCFDKSDEDDKTTCANVINSCSGPNNCQQHCANITNIGYKCSCKFGFTLTEDGYTCKDVDLCKKWGTCSQVCNPSTKWTQTKGKIECSCDAGYYQVFDDTIGKPTCMAIGSVVPQMLVANERILIQSDLNKLKGGEEHNVSVSLASGDKMVSMDVDMTSKDIWTGFFISHDNHTIKKFHIIPPASGSKRKENNSRKRRGLSGFPKRIVDDVAEPKGITVDWISKHIYWTDSHTRTIEMTDFPGQRRITVIGENLDQPYSVAVAPEAGKLFWTDRGFPPKIESSNLDGSGRKDVVKDDIIWPNGLAVDFSNKRIYWTDTKKHTIETVTLSGEDRQIVKRFNASDPPFMLDVFEDYLYVSLYRSHSIVRLHKFGSQDQEHYLMRNMTSIFDIVIMHPAKQKMSITNYCASNSSNDLCSGALCVNLPQAKDPSPNYKCLCSQDAVFEDGKCNFKKQCEEGYCKNGGTCHSLAKGLSKCSCANGYFGDRCERYKCSGFCMHQGHCIIKGNDATCRCPIMYTGDRCEIPVKDVCASFCENNGTCTTEMVHTVTRRRCKCTVGFKGERCEQCDSHYCLNGAICHHDRNHKPYCECPKLMVNRDKCLGTVCEGHCLNGGQCSHTAETDNLKCVCQKGFVGERCEVNHNTCSSYCKNGATCLTLNTIEKPFMCLCKPGFTGVKCDMIADKCDMQHCHKKEFCKIHKNGHAFCFCPTVYTGIFCETCLCKNGGECKPNPKKSSSHMCVCKQQWKGQLCETSVCSDYCFNGGTCNNCTYSRQEGQGICESCMCPPEFKGQRCAQMSQKQPEVPSSIVILIIVPIIVVLIIILIFVMTLVIRRRRDQFKHNRMPDVTQETHNPIYTGQQDQDDDRDLALLDDYEQDNRLYSSDSRHALLDDNSLYEESPDVHFHNVKNSKDKSNGKGPYA